MNRQSIATYLFLPFIAVATAHAGPSSSQKGSAIVSVVRLLESPERYEDRSISVKGYLSNVSGLNLYVTEDHALIRDFASKIFVSQDPGISESQCANGYVEIVGKFVRIDRWSFGIVSIEKISHAMSNEVCWAPASKN